MRKSKNFSRPYDQPTTYPTTSTYDLLRATTSYHELPRATKSYHELLRANTCYYDFSPYELLRQKSWMETGHYMPTIRLYSIRLAFPYSDQFKTINGELFKVSDWLVANRLSFNIKKTNTITSQIQLHTKRLLLHKHVNKTNAHILALKSCIMYHYTLFMNITENRIIDTQWHSFNVDS